MAFHQSGDVYTGLVKALPDAHPGSGPSGANNKQLPRIDMEPEYMGYVHAHQILKAPCSLYRTKLVGDSICGRKAQQLTIGQIICMQIAADILRDRPEESMLHGGNILFVQI